jgi:hypothetical protein
MVWPGSAPFYFKTVMPSMVWPQLLVPVNGMNYDLRQQNREDVELP